MSTFDNIGIWIYTNLIEIDKNTKQPTGRVKPNIPTDPDYIPPVEDVEKCPIPTTFFANTTILPTTTTTTIPIEYNNSILIVIDSKLEQFTFSLREKLDVDIVRVDWGDGSTKLEENHQYQSHGIYKISFQTVNLKEFHAPNSIISCVYRFEETIKRIDLSNNFLFSGTRISFLFQLLNSYGVVGEISGVDKSEFEYDIYECYVKINNQNRELIHEGESEVEEEWIEQIGLDAAVQLQMKNWFLRYDRNNLFECATRYLSYKDRLRSNLDPKLDPLYSVKISFSDNSVNKVINPEQIFSLDCIFSSNYWTEVYDYTVNIYPLIQIFRNNKWEVFEVLGFKNGNIDKITKSYSLPLGNYKFRLSIEGREKRLYSSEISLNVIATTTTTTTSTTTTTTLPYETTYWTGRYEKDDDIHVPPGGTIKWINQFGQEDEVVGLILGDYVVVNANKIIYTLGVKQTVG